MSAAGIVFLLLMGMIALMSIPVLLAIQYGPAQSQRLQDEKRMARYKDLT